MLENNGIIDGGGRCWCQEMAWRNWGEFRGFGKVGEVFWFGSVFLTNIQQHP